MENSDLLRVMPHAGQAGRDAEGDKGPIDPSIGKHGWHGYRTGAGNDGCLIALEVALYQFPWFFGQF